MNKKEKEDAQERLNGLGLPAWENPETGVLETRPEFLDEADERAEVAATNLNVENGKPEAKGK